MFFSNKTKKDCIHFIYDDNVKVETNLRCLEKNMEDGTYSKCLIGATTFLLISMIFYFDLQLTLISKVQNLLIFSNYVGFCVSRTLEKNMEDGNLKQTKKLNVYHL